MWYKTKHLIKAEKNKSGGSGDKYMKLKKICF